MSPSLKHESIKYTFNEIVKKNPKLFSADNEGQALLEVITRRIKTKLFSPEDDIITQGHDATNDYVFFLVKGEVYVSVRDEKRQEKQVNKLTSGAIFGETAILYNCSRTASV